MDERLLAAGKAAVVGGAIGVVAALLATQIWPTPWSFTGGLVAVTAASVFASFFAAYFADRG